MRKLLLGTAMLSVMTGSVQASEIGPLRMTDKQGDWAVGLHYFYGKSQWNTGSNLGDNITGDVVQKGPFAVFAYAFHDDWEVAGTVGGSQYETDPDYSGARLSSSLDTSFSVSVRGEFLRHGKTSFGPFLQYTRYADYEITGDITAGSNSGALDAETDKWQKLNAGLMAQHALNPMTLYYGIYHSDHSVDISGTYNGSDIKETAKEDGHTGLFIGAIHPVTDQFSLSLEYDHISSNAVSVGVNYSFEPPKPVVITRTEVQYVEKPKPTGPANIKRIVRFEKDGAEVKEAFWGEVREFANFLLTYDNSEGFIEGHCDCLGTDDYNMKLSARRAEAVKAILVNLFGIEEERLYIVPMGETDPEVEPDQEHGRPENRRVVLVGEAYGDK